MTAKECLMMLREIKDVAFATVDEDGEPQVRIIDVMLVDDDKLYFCTARGKDFYSQLTADGRVAVTGMNDKYQMVRLSGEAKKVEGQEAWIDKIFDNNPSMNDIYPADIYWNPFASITAGSSFSTWEENRYSGRHSFWEKPLRQKKVFLSQKTA